MKVRVDRGTYDYSDLHDEFERDSNRRIWEWRDVAPDDYDREMIRAIAKSRRATGQLVGDKYHDD